MTVEASPGLSPINQALEPAWVRHGSAETQKTYQTALAFERMLVEQLSKSLTAASGLEGEAGTEDGGSASSLGASQLTSLLPQALSDGVMSSGGLGLAAQLTRDAQNAHGALHAQAAQRAQTPQANGGTASTTAHTTTATTGGVGT
jgi:Rod binding domain-containing protein